jgi:hypothetical protein
MDNLFDACVEFLRWLGDIVGLSYKEINIWIFVIIEPLSPQKETHNKYCGFFLYIENHFFSPPFSLK